MVHEVHREQTWNEHNVHKQSACCRPPLVLQRAARVCGRRGKGASNMPSCDRVPERCIATRNPQNTLL